MKVLVTRAIPAEGIEILKENIDRVVVNPHNRPLTAAELAAESADVDGLLCMLADKIDAALIAGAGRLKVISTYAVGYDNIDLAAAKARKIVVANTPDVLTEATADIAFGLIIACARRFIEADRCLREGGFAGWSPLFMVGTEVHGKTLGIVGAGRIGQAVAKRGLGFGMTILYVSRSPKPEFEKATGAVRTSLDDLLRRADFVSLNCPFSKENLHMIGRDQLHMMKPTAYLINTARGKLVDEGALVDALRDGTIAGTGLDVYEDEPRVHPGLPGLENAVLLPHIGSASRETRAQMAITAAKNLLSALKGEEPLYRII